MLSKEFLRNEVIFQLSRVMRFIGREIEEYNCIDDCQYCEYNTICEAQRDIDDILLKL